MANPRRTLVSIPVAFDSMTAEEFDNEPITAVYGVVIEKQNGEVNYAVMPFTATREDLLKGEYDDDFSAAIENLERFASQEACNRFGGPSDVVKVYLKPLIEILEKQYGGTAILTTYC